MTELIINSTDDKLYRPPQFPAEPQTLRTGSVLTHDLTEFSHTHYLTSGLTLILQPYLQY